ncbi:VOC family protein [Nocardioides yefusunii]|uniref:VOC family protein n=1 Tax=Nocardioides yefusunii TaxID=2500546 RepID=A0ABW1QSV3_9ACTN|nr:VOC family protein [Nocardioides yefusunii]
MFDGIDELVLPVASLDEPLHLYRDLMGFTLASRHPASPHLAELWDLPAAVTEEVLLTKPGASGGALRLALTPGLPPADPAGRPDRAGPYALDFYLRDAAAVEDRCTTAGRRFVTEAVHYELPGTTIPVRERMLIQDDSGLLHAFVQHRPRGTRCVLDQAPAEDISEVAAAVFMTDRFEDARAFAREILGGQEYFVGRFDGPGVEAMLALDPGEGFIGALYRGATSANARLEFGEAITSERSPDPVHRVIARVAVDDLDRVEAQLAGGVHGRVTGRHVVDGVSRLGLVSAYGAVFDLHQRR